MEKLQTLLLIFVILTIPLFAQEQAASGSMERDTIVEPNEDNLVIDPQEIRDLRIGVEFSYQELQNATNIEDLFPISLQNEKWKISSYQITVSGPGVGMMLFTCDGSKLCDKFNRSIAKYHSKDHTYGISNVQYKAGNETLELGFKVMVVIYVK